MPHELIWRFNLVAESDRYEITGALGAGGRARCIALDINLGLDLTPKTNVESSEWARKWRQRRERLRERPSEALILATRELADRVDSHLGPANRCTPEACFKRCDVVRATLEMEFDMVANPGRQL